MALEPGSIIDDKYRVIRLIGEGGMGAVYHGENTRIRRQVAIKVLHAAVARDAEVVQRFEREAQAAGCIGNDHILEVLDLGVLPSGDRYIVMEFLDGESLSARLERVGRMPPGDLSPIILQMLDGLAAAHQAGITHRDLKPDNVFLLKKKAGHIDFVKIIDFGISKFNKADGGVKMTRSGVVMGTPLYMSPEQARTAEADARSDLYSVGVIMYEAVTGRVPFTAEQFSQLLVQIVMGDYVPLHVAAPDIDPRFTAIVTKAMARERPERFQSADEFRAAIEDWRVGAGLGRLSAVAPTMAMMGQTPPPGAGPAPWTTPYPAPPGLVTPHPHPQALAHGMTPHPAPQAPAAPAMTPYPHPQGTPPPGMTPYPHPQGGAVAPPYPTPAGRSPSGAPAGAPPAAATPAPFQGSSHAWGASQAGAAGGPGTARASNRTVPLVIAAVVVVGAAAAIGVPRLLPSRGAASGPAAPSAESLPPAVVPAPSASPPTTLADPVPVKLPPVEPPAAASTVAAAPAASSVAPAAAAPHAAAPRPASPPPRPVESKPAAPKPAPNKSSPDFGY
jgi:serine/threonine-protein kinase